MKSDLIWQRECNIKYSLPLDKKKPLATARGTDSVAQLFTIRRLCGMLPSHLTHSKHFQT